MRNILFLFLIVFVLIAPTAFGGAGPPDQTGEKTLVWVTNIGDTDLAPVNIASARNGTAWFDNQDDPAAVPKLKRIIVTGTPANSSYDYMYSRRNPAPTSVDYPLKFLATVVASPNTTNYSDHAETKNGFRNQRGYWRKIPT